MDVAGVADPGFPHSSGVSDPGYNVIYADPVLSVRFGRRRKLHFAEELDEPLAEKVVFLLRRLLVGIAFEDDLHAILFRMVDKPLIELLGHVSMSYYRSHPLPIFGGEEGFEAWKGWRRQIIAAILARDPELARRYALVREELG